MLGSIHITDIEEDGGNRERKPVACGVFFIWTAQSECKGKKVGKVAIVG